jgi:hypothetical protein
MSSKRHQHEAPRRPLIPRWIYELELRPTELSVWLKIWSHADADGWAWPSGETIARACRINIDSLWPALASLEERGLLRRLKQSGRNQYQVIVPHFPTSGSVDLQSRRAPSENFGRKNTSRVTGKGGLGSLEKEGEGHWNPRGLDPLEREGYEGSPGKVVSATNSAQQEPIGGTDYRERVRAPDVWESWKNGPPHNGQKQWQDLTIEEMKDVWYPCYFDRRSAGDTAATAEALAALLALGVGRGAFEPEELAVLRAA